MAAKHLTTTSEQTKVKGKGLCHQHSEFGFGPHVETSSDESEGAKRNTNQDGERSVS